MNSFYSIISLLKLVFILTITSSSSSCFILQIPSKQEARFHTLGHCLESSSNPNENYFENPNDFDLSVQITSYQSSQQQPTSNSEIIQPYQYNLRNKRNVWIVDDEEIITQAVGIYLLNSGYKVQTFQNATLPLSIISSIENEKAKSKAGQRQTQAELEELSLPDAIISDIMMPHVSGLQFLSVIRSNPQTMKIPFLLLTAKGTTEDRIEGYNAGTDGYLQKPFDPDELVVILDTIIERKEFLESKNDVDDVSVDELKRDLYEIKSLLKESKTRTVHRNDFIQNRRKGLDSSKSSNNSSNDNMEQNNTNDNNSEEDIGLDDFRITGYDELEVLRLLCDGYTNKEIAKEMKYSTRWVEGILTKLFRKTNCSNRTELVRWAVASGNIDI